MTLILYPGNQDGMFHSEHHQAGYFSKMACFKVVDVHSEHRLPIVIACTNGVAECVLLVWRLLYGGTQLFEYVATRGHAGADDLLL